MAREEIGESISSFQQTIGLSSIVGLTLIPGQMSVYIRRISGGTIEIGGASLTWGAGYALQTAAESVFPITNTMYVAVTGSTGVISVTRQLSSAAFGG